MLRHVRCGTSLRAAVILTSGALAFLGWSAVLLIRLMGGDAAGVDPDFFIAMAVAMTSSTVFGQSLVTPGHARVYGIGWRDGIAWTERGEDDKPKRLLRSV